MKLDLSFCNGHDLRHSAPRNVSLVPVYRIGILAAMTRVCLTLWMPLLILLMGPGSPLQAADQLVWKSDKVAADISGWKLPKLLETLSTATGWQIFVEPETEHVVSTRFKDRPQGEALRLLLGDLNFALLPPQTNGPSRLYVFRTSMQEATQLIKAAEKKDAARIGNELIVTLKPGANIDELAKKLGAKVVGRMDKFNTYRLQFDDAEAADKARTSLQDNGDVASVEDNFQINIPINPDSLTASSAAPINLTPKASADGSKLIVGVIDTAVQRQGTGIEDFLLASLSVAGESKTADDQPTHGTSMAETIARALALLSKDGQSSFHFLPVDVYGGKEFTSTYDVARGIYEAVNNGAQIINLSLGSSGDSPFLQKVIQSSHDQGVLFFAAAGNEPVSTPTYPAAYPDVIAVTAGTRQGTIAPYANFGAFVDAIAPGSAIVNYKGQSWVIMGTSASTAYASGVAAAMLEKNSNLSRAQLEAQIRAALGLKKQ